MYSSTVLKRAVVLEKKFKLFWIQCLPQNYMLQYLRHLYLSFFLLYFTLYSNDTESWRQILYFTPLYVSDNLSYLLLCRLHPESEPT